MSPAAPALGRELPEDQVLSACRDPQWALDIHKNGSRGTLLAQSVKWLLISAQIVIPEEACPAPNSRFPGRLRVLVGGARVAS